jgi:hypothetical protein
MELDVSSWHCSMWTRFELFSFSLLLMYKESFLFFGLAIRYKSSFVLTIRYKVPRLLLYSICLFSWCTTKTKFQLQFQSFLLLFHTHQLGDFVEGVLIEGFEEVEQRSEGKVEA